MSDDLKVETVTLTADQAVMLREVLTAIGRSGAIDYVHGQACIPSHLIQEAREAAALLPEPVDGDALEAERIAYELDGGLPRDLVLAGMKAGRALERDGREG